MLYNMRIFLYFQSIVCNFKINYSEYIYGKSYIIAKAHTNRYVTENMLYILHNI